MIAFMTMTSNFLKQTKNLDQQIKPPAQIAGYHRRSFWQPKQKPFWHVANSLDKNLKSWLADRKQANWLPQLPRPPG
jgi:hypothetical protein